MSYAKASKSQASAANEKNSKSPDGKKGDSQKMASIRTMAAMPGSLDEFPGVGPAAVKKLSENGIRTVQQLVAHIINHGDEATFAGWLKNTIGMNSNYAGQTAEAAFFLAKKFNIGMLLSNHISGLVFIQC